MIHLVAINIFILLFIILFWGKVRKGISLDKEERVIEWLGIFFIALSVFFQILTWLNITPSFLTIYFLPITIILIIIGVILISLVFISRRQRKVENIDPRFHSIVIYYSDEKDSPDSKEPHIPYFVANYFVSRAYWVPNNLNVYVRQHYFQHFSFKNKKAIMALLKKQKIEIHDELPKSDADMGLRFRSDGNLYGYYNVDATLLNKFKENRNKFSDFKIAFLYPWLRKPVYPPNRRVLIKISTNEIFESPTTPIYDLDLVENSVLDSQNYTRFPYEPYWLWSWRNHFKPLHRWRYPIENELADENKTLI